MGIKSFFYGFVPETWTTNWAQGMMLRSYTGVMLVNSIKAKRRDQILKWVLRQLSKKFTPDEIARIYEKYSSAKKSNVWGERWRTWRYNRRLTRFVEEFLYYLQMYKDYYIYVMNLIAQSFISGDRDEYKELIDVDAVFRGIWQKRGTLVFPRREVRRFRQQISELLWDLRKDLIKDATSTTRVQRGGYPAGVSIFSPKRWRSRASLYRQERRQIRRLGREDEYYKELFDKVQNELGKGVQQDFLFLLIELFKRVDVADRRLEQIKQDLQVILKRMFDELKQVDASLTKMFLLFQNDPRIRPLLEAKKKDMENLKSLLSRVEQDKFKNVQALVTRLKQLTGESSAIMSAMEAKAVA